MAAILFSAEYVYFQTAIPDNHKFLNYLLLLFQLSNTILPKLLLLRESCRITSFFRPITNGLTALSALLFVISRFSFSRYLIKLFFWFIAYETALPVRLFGKASAVSQKLKKPSTASFPFVSRIFFISSASVILSSVENIFSIHKNPCPATVE